MKNETLSILTYMCNIQYFGTRIILKCRKPSFLFIKYYNIVKFFKNLLKVPKIVRKVTIEENHISGFVRFYFIRIGNKHVVELEHRHCVSDDSLKFKDWRRSASFCCCFSEEQVWRGVYVICRYIFFDEEILCSNNFSYICWKLFFWDYYIIHFFL